jgi:hypothetical protein
VFEFEGSKANNILWQGRGIKPNFDPRDPDPNRRYKGMTREAGFTPVFSPDGVHWKRGDKPATNQAYDATSFHWDPVNEKWIASVKMFKDGKRVRGYAESSDYENWTDTYLMLTADERDDPEDQLYSMRIFRYESIYVGLLKVYHVSTDKCDIQLAFSRNAKHWERPCRTPFLSNSPEENAYDRGNIDESGNPIRMGDELWFYYSGRSTLHNQAPEETNGSLCLATLRLDGFISLDAAQNEGTLLTKPLLLEGRSLYVNADAQGGTIGVEIVEAEGDTPIEPFGFANALPISANGVRQEVTWTGDPNLEDLKGKPVRLRFSLRNARLYSFWME